MDDLIGRAQAIKLLMGEAVGKYPQSFYFGLFAAAKELKELPAVDAVPVVRCKDCKSKFFNEDLEMNCCLVWGDGYEVVQDDGFCSYGERKET